MFQSWSLKARKRLEINFKNFDDNKYPQESGHYKNGHLVGTYKWYNIFTCSLNNETV